MRRAAVLILFAMLPAIGAEPTLVERSQQKAAAVLDRAVAAVGGKQALAAIEAFRFTVRGPVAPRLQTPDVTPTQATALQAETATIDLKAQRMVFEQCFSGYGLEGHNTLVLEGGQGTLSSHLERKTWPVSGAQANPAQIVAQSRRVPLLLLRQAAANPAALRYLGEESVGGRLHDVVGVTTDESQSALFIDRESGLLSRTQRIVPDPVDGLLAVESVFGEYVAAGAYRVPRDVTLRQGGQDMARYAMQVEINPDSARRIVETPKGYAQETAESFDARVEKLGEGVWLLQNVAAPNYHTLAVEFADHVLAVDAALSGPTGDRIIARIKEAIPGKPIRYVAITHHHGDHIGGLRSFAAEGATVITTPGNRELIETMMAARHDDRLAREPQPSRIMLVDKGRRVFSDATQTVELIDVGPNVHAREILVVYLPRQRVLFQADLFITPNAVLPFAATAASTAALLQRLREANASVATVASSHGRIVRFEELERFAGNDAPRSVELCRS